MVVVHDYIYHMYTPPRQQASIATLLASPPPNPPAVDFGRTQVPRSMLSGVVPHPISISHGCTLLHFTCVRVDIVRFLGPSLPRAQSFFTTL